MRKISASGRLRKKAGTILCAAVMLVAAIVMPVKADEEVNVELKYEPSGTMEEIAPEATEVGKHGKLSIADVDGYTAPVIVDKDKNPYQLRGVSTHGLSWFSQYVNKEAFQTFRDYWGVNLIRIAVYAHEGENAYVNQYAKELTEKEGHVYVEGQNQEYNDKLIQEGVQSAADLGMYVIIDWHVLNYNPNEDLEEATAFFQKYATMYKDYDNVIFEVCNEPTGTAWFNGSDNDLYSYCTRLTNVIRECGSDAIVICGTDNYSSKVDEVAGHLLEDRNTIYTCHFYAASHYADPMKKLTDALENGVPVIVSEYGVCTASGDGRCDVENADAWLDICDKNNVSYACWAISDSNEAAAYFQENLAKYDGNWTEEDLTTTSKYIINRYNDRKEETEDLQSEEETIGEEISQADENVSTPAENRSKSPMIPIVITVVVLAAGAVVIVKNIDFVKKNYEIFVVNFIVLGFIAFTLLAQFGVHIKVDKGVDLVPIEIGYSQSTVHINSKFVDVSERYVRLNYENKEQKSFWMLASVVFGRAGEDDIKDMIKDGDSIKRNVFLNTRSNEVVGVTKRGRSILSLYYFNSKMFRYGILLLIIVDIFVGFLIKGKK